MKRNIAALSGSLLVALVVTSSSIQSAGAGQDECNYAIDRYNSAVDEVAHTLKRYANCVSGSQANDDCSSEFRRIKNAQYEFESAVSDYGNECN